MQDVPETETGPAAISTPIATACRLKRVLDTVVPQVQPRLEPSRYI